MAASKKYYTNVRSEGVSTTSVSRRRNPRISKTSAYGLLPLTDREREARRQDKLVRSASSIGGDVAMSEHQSFFSVPLSTDFLELPQSLREKRELYRHFYNSDEIVAQSIDLHTELPMSKVRLTQPKPRTCPKGFDNPDDYGKYILTFFERMSKRTKMFQRLITAVHHYWLDGTCLPPDEWVTVEGGIVRADQVGIGDRVLTHLGRWREVTAVRGFDADKLVALDIARLPGQLRVTPEHPIEILLDGVSTFVEAGLVQQGDWVRITWPLETGDVLEVDLLQNVPSYVESTTTGYVVTRTQTKPRNANAQQARQKLIRWLDSLTAPVVRSRESLAQEFDVPLSTLHNVIHTLERETDVVFKVRDPRTTRYSPSTVWFPVRSLEENPNYEIPRRWEFTSPSRLKITEDLLYVLGYWLGDGTLSRDSCRSTEWGRGSWSICFGEGSEIFQTHITKVLGDIFGSGNLRLEYNHSSNTYNLYLNGCPAFVEWSSINFGDTSHGPNPKRVPTWVLTLPLNKQRAFLAGLLDSDGCVSSRCVGGVSLGMTSLSVISAARDIMLRLGAVPSFGQTLNEKPVVIDGVVKGHSKHPIYQLAVHEREMAFSLISSSLKRDRLLEDAKFHETPNSYKIVGKDLYFLVRSVSSIGPSPVLNFQVREDETFRAHFVSTHNCAMFAEDSEVQVPDSVGYDRHTKMAVLTDDGETVDPEDEWVEKETREKDELAYYQKHYQGWERLILFPMDQIKVTTLNYSEKVRIELIPSDRDRALIEQANLGDSSAEELVEDIPDEVREFIREGKLIPLGVDPDEGSFCYLLRGRQGIGDDLGQSILDRCLKTLLYRDKLRQAQTQIASRAMTPKRIVWAEDISETDVDNLREQVDLALVDPDYTIVTNYEVHWEEMGSRDRLLDLSTEYEQTERRLRTGLGVTESLLSGETLYSGDRLKLEVINQRYLFLREMLQEYVEEYLFKPVALRKGFVEKDKWGDDVILYPKLSFTRLPLRDSQDTYDALFNLYQKGSIPIELILEMFNIDAQDCKVKLENDLFTVNDAVFNEVIRGIYGSLGNTLAESTDIGDKIAKYLKLKKNPPPPAEEGGRF